MSVKIRLQRHGKKGKPYFHIVVADARATRDGKFIERIGSYNPNTNPATIELNFDASVQWLENGAQPTDTCRAILSYKGVLYKKHLNGGIRKGALTPEQAEEKFNQWLDGKSDRIMAKVEGLSATKASVKQAALAAEAEKKSARAAAIAAKNAPAPVVEEEEVPATEEAAAPEAEAESAE